MAAVTDAFGGVPRALRFLESRNGPEALERTQEARFADLLVYLALMQSERRPPYGLVKQGRVDFLQGQYHY